MRLLLLVRSETLLKVLWLDCVAPISFLALKLHCAAPESVHGFSQRSRSSASERAEEYRRFGFFSRDLRQIVERSRSIFGFNKRGCFGSVSSTNLIVSSVVPPAKGGWPVSSW